MTERPPGLARAGTVAYGVVAYLAFLATFAYLVGFLGNLLVPKGIDDGATGSAALAVGVDVALVTAFALQHSVMARPGFKRVWTRVVPASIERSTYVLLSSLVLGGLAWQWRPLPETVWSVEPAWARAAVWAVFGVGWVVVVSSTYLIGHYDMFGLKQVLARWHRRPYAEPPFAVPGLYQLVRHPLYVGFLLAFWAAPDLSTGRLLFAATATAYILVAVRFEERDLVDQLGEQYARYAAEVPRFVPRPNPGAMRPDAVTLGP